MPKIEIASSDRVAIVGATGSGKTFLSRHLLWRVKRLVVCDPKGTLRGQWALEEWSETTRAKLLEGEPVRVRIASPIIRGSKESPDWEPYLWDVYDAGNVLLYVDEVYGVVPIGRKSQALNAIYTRGRELGIGAFACSQRPSWIPLELLSESSWFFMFRLLLQEDRDRMAAMMGPQVKEPFREPYGFWTYNVAWEEPVFTPQLEVKVQRQSRAPARETAGAGQGRPRP